MHSYRPRKNSLSSNRHVLTLVKLSQTYDQRFESVYESWKRHRIQVILLLEGARCDGLPTFEDEQIQESEPGNGSRYCGLVLANKRLQALTNLFTAEIERIKAFVGEWFEAIKSIEGEEDEKCDVLERHLRRIESLDIENLVNRDSSVFSNSEDWVVAKAVLISEISG